MSGFLCAVHTLSDNSYRFQTLCSRLTANEHACGATAAPYKTQCAEISPPHVPRGLRAMNHVLLNRPSLTSCRVSLPADWPCAAPHKTRCMGFFPMRRAFFCRWVMSSSNALPLAVELMYLQLAFFRPAQNAAHEVLPPCAARFLSPSGHVLLEFGGVGRLQLIRRYAVTEQRVVIVHQHVGQLLDQMRPQRRIARRRFS